ncbi:MAG: UDP-N-acetylglucosamine 2-epimerase (non-hydrolyzing), partial [Acidobacteriota bacterium]
MKILNVVGARPNFVKIAPITSEMRKRSGITPLLVHTGQHYDREMSGSFFRDLDIPRPDYHLHVGPGSSASQVSAIIGRLEPVMAQERPDVVLVVGDVNSTLAGALTAVKLGIPVVHVEAGLRSFDRKMPEEINRVITDAVSDLLFVSEPSGVGNLLREGHPPERIFLVGNVMIDTLKEALKRKDGAAIFASKFNSICQTRSSAPRYALLTLHRQGLVDDPVLFGKIWIVLKEIGQRIPIIFPVHPRTRLRLQTMECKSFPASGQGNGSIGIHMIDPLGYPEFLGLEKE